MKTLYGIQNEKHLRNHPGPGDLPLIPVRDTFIAELIIKKPVTTHSFTRAEIEQIVVMQTLHLYNRNIPCGAKAIYKKLDREGIRPLPLLEDHQAYPHAHGLTHGRIARYP